MMKTYVANAVSQINDFSEFLAMYGRKKSCTKFIITISTENIEHIVKYHVGLLDRLHIAKFRYTCIESKWGKLNPILKSIP